MKKRIRKYRIIVFVCIGMFAACSIYAIKEYNRKSPDTHQLKAAFEFSADDLVRLFETEESMATTQYADKVIRVQGLVGSVQLTDTSGTVFLNIENSMSSVMCQFDQKTLHEILELQTGNPVTIKGICSGFLMDVVLVKCVIEN